MRFESKTWYTIDANDGGCSLANPKGNGDKFDTYKEAYIELVNAVSGEMGDGYEPTLYTIREHSFTRYGETENTMVRPVWS